MKTQIIVCIAALVLSITTYSQTSEAPDGAAGVKFGMTPSEVKAIWRTKGTIDEDYNIIKASVGTLTYVNLTVGSEEFDLGAAKFVNNKLYEIALWKLPSQDGYAQGIYDDLQTILNNKYKKGEAHRHFTGIYEDGDGYEMQAVILGDATIMTFWDYSPISMISLEIRVVLNSVAITMTYQSLALFKEVERALNSVNKDEF